jgi:hypothetical protein
MQRASFDVSKPICFPPLGKRPIAEITTPEIVAAIKIEARGALDIVNGTPELIQRASIYRCR